MRLIGLAVVVFVNLAVASLGAGAQEKDRPEPYRIRPEDILRITVWKNDAMSGTVQVRPDGKISLPLLNQVQAAGLTAHELRDVLVDKLKEYESRPAVSVIVTGFRSLKSVWGLGVPLELDPTSCVTVQDVLNTLGFTKFEKGSKIVILHPEGKAMRQIPFDYSKVERKKSCLRRGDILLMP